MNSRNSSFIEQVLDGHARIDQFDSQISAWMSGSRARPLHEVLGLNSAELELVASLPDALRYIIHARRFGRAAPQDSLRSQSQITRYSLQLASLSRDPFELASIESWLDEESPKHSHA